MVLRHWEDVVFENRNKLYGAYTLRRDYAKRLILGWGISVAIFAALLYLPKLVTPGAHEVIGPVPLTSTSVRVLPPPPIKRNIPIVKQVQQSRPSASTQVIVTKDPVANTIESTEPHTPTTDDTGVEGTFDGSVDGTSTIPVVDLPYTEPVEHRVHDVVEVMPRYEGGMEAMMKFIRKKIRVPASFRYLTEGGTVYVRFVVQPDGKVSDVEVLRGLSKDCDKEAMRVISIMPGWIAGIQNGTSVPVRMVLPIKFAHE